MTSSINVHHYGARHEAPDCTVDFSACQPTGQAEPTSRLLDGSCDHGYAEEWAESITLPDGRKATRYYLFSAESIVDDDDEPVLAEDYPWDADHCSWIELDE